ncbi:MAG: ABC transporter ATP-binding protein [Bacilli bacterium]
MSNHEAVNEAILEIKDLSVAYGTAKGDVLAVQDMNLRVLPNEIMGLIGESGSGKSTLAYAVMRLLKGSARVVKGSVRILGKDIYAMDKEELRQFRWANISMVFQSAMNALNPVLTVETQIVDTILNHRPQLSRREAREKAHELVDLVRIDRSRITSYPHELSGGMRQRIVIAIAISLEPSLVIMDEPTTALDVVVQRSILDQIKEIQQRVQFSVLFISHDFSLVSHLASRIAIMYAGRVVEVTEARSLMDAKVAHHPYTEGLWRAIPKLSGKSAALEGIAGTPPDLLHPPSGCAFHPRCRYTFEPCRTVRPQLQDVEGSEIACHRFVPEGIQHGQ